MQSMIYFLYFLQLYHSKKKKMTYTSNNQRFCIWRLLLYAAGACRKLKWSAYETFGGCAGRGKYFQILNKWIFDSLCIERGAWGRMGSPSALRSGCSWALMASSWSFSSKLRPSWSRSCSTSNVTLIESRLLIIHMYHSKKNKTKKT